MLEQRVEQYAVKEIDREGQVEDLQEGDLVWAKLNLRNEHKLSPRWHGPYRIRRRNSDILFNITPVNAEDELPERANAVNIQYLKRYFDPTIQVEEDDDDVVQP